MNTNHLKWTSNERISLYQLMTTVTILDKKFRFIPYTRFFYHSTTLVHLVTITAPMNQKPYAIHWFRRDLRLQHNTILNEKIKAYGGRVLGFFCFDPVFLGRPDFSVNRFSFFLNTLADLKKSMQAAGGDLLVLDEGPEKSFTRLLTHCKKHSIPLPAAVSWNRDYEPFARARDERITSLLKNEFGISCFTSRDHLIIEPHEIEVGSTKSFYKVYTPFKNKWQECLISPDMRLRIPTSDINESTSPCRLNMQWKDLFSKSEPFTDQLERYQKDTLKKVSVPIPAAGVQAAQNSLQEFLENGIDAYDVGRDFPDRPGTSKLSIYLKNGSLTTAQILGHLVQKAGGFKQLLTKSKNPTPTQKYLSELIWREFYYHILYHRPEVEKTAFNPKYKDIEWENNEEHFQAWCDGLTGFPMVDAGMRQLKETGWMHNRVRMIVASFLTKDLLIDWRWGEQYFMKTLLDGDLAPNNGGWQWAASTGCDPQPYFRIFNPTLQGKRFDPEGNYIRKYLPELKDVEDRYIHEPWLSSKKRTYPAPIVDHRQQSLKAIALFRSKVT